MFGYTSICLSLDTVDDDSSPPHYNFALPAMGGRAKRARRSIYLARGPAQERERTRRRRRRRRRKKVIWCVLRDGARTSEHTIDACLPSVLVDNDDDDAPLRGVRACTL